MNTDDTLPPADAERMLMPREVAALLGVTTRTIVNWSRAGKIQCSRTLGGHRRFPEKDVQALRAGMRIPQQRTSED